MEPAKTGGRGLRRPGHGSASIETTAEGSNSVLGVTTVKKTFCRTQRTCYPPLYCSLPQLLFHAHRYAHRTTRRIAKTTLEVLCPEGAWSRKVINVAFRVLHQHQLSWMKSLVLYTYLKIMALYVALVAFLWGHRQVRQSDT